MLNTVKGILGDSLECITLNPYLMNPFSIEGWFGSNNINKRHNTRVMGKILGGREAHYSRGWGTRRGALLGGDKIGWYRG